MPLSNLVAVELAIIKNPCKHTISFKTSLMFIDVQIHNVHVKIDSLKISSTSISDRYWPIVLSDINIAWINIDK